MKMTVKTETHVPQKKFLSPLVFKCCCTLESLMGKLFEEQMLSSLL